MPLELKQHYVAFLDVLGFKDMVESDIKDNDHAFLSKLFRCHQGAAAIFQDDPNCSITQFSDSIVVAKPYEDSAFDGFISSVAQYQRLLLDEGLICRGGIAVNKHFSNGTFTFSAGLIDAYMVESKSARYPRVVVSKEVLQLVFPGEAKLSSLLIQEDDGQFFVDYIGITKRIRPKKLGVAIKDIVSGLLLSSNSSVREKGLWLAAYADSVTGTSLKPPRFTGTRVSG